MAERRMFTKKSLMMIILWLCHQVRKPYICIYLCLLMMTDFAIRYQFPCSKLTQVWLIYNSYWKKIHLSV